MEHEDLDGPVAEAMESMEAAFLAQDTSRAQAQRRIVLLILMRNGLMIASRSGRSLDAQMYVNASRALEDPFGFH